MYLACNTTTNIRSGNGVETRYVLRESRRQEGLLCSCDLADLGPDPGQYISYDSGGSFHLDEQFLDGLREQGIEISDSELEDIFIPFVDPSVKARLEPFRLRHRYRNWQPAADSLCQRVLQEIHIMDRRRLCFLRLGNASPEILDKKSVLYTVLLDKSRDEIEQLIWLQEQTLRPREVPEYLFTIFDLGRFFQESYARSMPQALNPERLDELFLQEICVLNEDKVFWQGFSRSKRLPTYLLRYLFLYFDAPQAETLPPGSFARARPFRRTRPTVSGAAMSRTQAMTIFALDSEALTQLSRKDLNRLYRKKARQQHPDRGGDSESFIRLTAAYEELLPSLR